MSDATYEALLAAHRDLDADRSAALNRALVLLLAELVDDETALRRAIARAREAALAG